MSCAGKESSVQIAGSGRYVRSLFRRPHLCTYSGQIQLPNHRRCSWANCQIERKWMQQLLPARHWCNSIWCDSINFASIHGPIQRRTASFCLAAWSIFVKMFHVRLKKQKRTILIANPVITADKCLHSGTNVTDSMSAELRFGTARLWNLSGCHCKIPQSFSINIFILDFSLNLSLSLSSYRFQSTLTQCFNLYQWSLSITFNLRVLKFSISFNLFQSLSIRFSFNQILFQPDSLANSFSETLRHKATLDP